jgi:hypothetical protein
MKRLASRLTWWHMLPHKSTRAVNAAERRGQPWTILPSTCTRGKARLYSGRGGRVGVAERVKGFLRAVGVDEDFVISGGISKNVGVVRRVEQKLGTTSRICFEPQVVGALGAALFAQGFLGRKA